MRRGNFYTFHITEQEATGLSLVTTACPQIIGTIAVPLGCLAVSSRCTLVVLSWPVGVCILFSSRTSTTWAATTSGGSFAFNFLLTI